MTLHRNDGLLRTLAAIRHHERTLAPVSSYSDYDNLELEIALSTAIKNGFAEATGMGGPVIRLTPDGEAWARDQVSDLRSLFPLVSNAFLEAAE